MKKHAIALAGALALGSVAAHADTGTYLGINVGQAHMNGNGFSSDTGDLLGLFVGQDLWKAHAMRLGVEGSYNTLGNFSGLMGDGHAREGDVSLIGTYYLDPANTVGLYAKAGVAHTWITAAAGGSSQTGGTYGVGVRYHFTPQVEGRLGAQYYDLGDSTPFYNHSTAWTLGAAYHF
ncbi:MAG: porin family protein [Betaproteobacteria bacterium]|nr:porin family protein [Betaproteobacteria bacterium]